MANPPTPPTNTGLGFHYFPDDQHYRTADLDKWLPELKALNASWLTLRGSPTRAIPEPFIRALLRAGIEPIVHIPIQPREAISLAELEPLYHAYANWGVHYVVLYDKPNTQSTWPAEAWGKPGLIPRFVDLLTPALELAASAGLTPVFPPLKQGGDYWDMSFLDTAIQTLRQRNPDLLKQMVFACYGFAFNHPVNWGLGGHTRWPGAKPYHTPPGSQDGRGFRAFEWYQDVIRARAGEERPLLMLAGGSRIGDSDDPQFLPVDQNRHTTCNIEIGMAMKKGELPDYLLNASFWLLSTATDSAYAPQAWFQPNGSSLPVVADLKAALAAPTASTANEETSRAAAPTTASGKTISFSASAKTIHHYLLLPTFEWGVSDWHWAAAATYIQTFQPTTGFSAQEAAAADHVTIVGNEQGISTETEMMLRTAGCKVERVCGRDGIETRSRLTEMAKAGLRFISEEALA